MGYLRCILFLTLLGMIGFTESLLLVGETSLFCGTVKTITCKVDNASAIPATLTWTKDTTTFTQCDVGGSMITCLNSVKQGKYITANFTKKEYYITFNATKLTDAGVWGCSDGSTSRTLTIGVETSQEASLTDPWKNGTLKLETNCLLPSLSSSLKVDWFYKDTSGKNQTLEPSIKPAANFELLTLPVCGANDCTGTGYNKYKLEETFKKGPCELTVLAMLSAGSNPPFLATYYPACIEAPEEENCTCKGYNSATIAVFVIDNTAVIALVVIVISVVVKQVHVPIHLISIVTISMHVTVVWSVIMDILLVKCTGCEEVWSLALNNITLCRSVISTVIKICFLILSRNLGKGMKKMYLFESTELDELKELACGLLVIDLSPYTLGLSFLVLVFFPSGSFAKAFESSNNDSGEHSQGQQGTGHSHREGNTIAPRDSGAVSRTDIELTDGNYGQENPMLRPQPPLPGIRKSHQQVDEPHYKKTRGLSSNFEDPNSLPQFEVRKTSLAPISATVEMDSDSTARKKKKKKKKKTEGRDTARSDED